MFKPLHKFGDLVQSVVVPLIAIKDNFVYSLGTGFIISPDGLIMTAKHVIDELYMIGNLNRGELNQKIDSVDLYAVIIKNESTGGLWPIDRVWMSDGIDIAVGWLRTAYLGDERLSHLPAKLSLYPPPVGTKVLAFGYYGVKSTIKSEGNVGVITQNQNTAFSDGRIIEVHDLFRDKAFIKWPCFRVNMRVEHGMSGSPVFNLSDNSVCGVITSSYQEKDNMDYLSYASILWPAMGIKVQLKKNEDDKNVTTAPLLDFITDAGIKITGNIKAVEIEEIGISQTVLFSPEKYNKT